MTRLLLRSLAFYWRSHLGVFAGALLAAAVLTGALLVGDSVDYSLRTFALLRLGKIDYAIDSRSQLISEELAARLGRQAGTPAVAALHLRGMAISQPASGAGDQINNVQVMGVPGSFWELSQEPLPGLAPYEVYVNAKLAAALKVKEGDALSLRVAKPSLMARDSPLSTRDEERSIRNRYTVKRVLGDAELGRFGLTPSQNAPYNAFVDLGFLQGQLEKQGKANLIVVGASSAAQPLQRALAEAWRPADIGLELRTCSDGIVQLESERIFLSEEVSKAALAQRGAQGTLTYLATSMAFKEKLTPYFFVVAGALQEALRDDEIVINRWMADALGAQPGDRVKLTYTQLLPNNTYQDASREFRVSRIVEMAALAVEKERMPVFPGLSDVESCSDWDVGMPMDDALLNDKANEEYWKTWRETPKAFVSLQAGQAMWSNRFGNLTAVRYPAGTSPPAVESALQQRIDPALAGLFPLPVREQALNAVSQAMDFGGLFLGMSFFLIVAAIVLTALLFRFGMEQRAREIGLLGAVGLPRRQIRLALLGEGTLVALAGAVIGAACGTLYTRALLYGLGHYWGGAVANASLLYHAEASSLAIGAVATVLCAVIAMALALRRLFQETPRDLLHADYSQQALELPRHSQRTWIKHLPAVLAVLALAIAVYALLTAGDAAPYFFGAGALLLLAGLGMFRNLLRGLGAGETPARFTLRHLAALNLSRRAGRSLAVAGILASGCFLVFAVSAMQEDIDAHAGERASGTGGFRLLAESTFPILEAPHGLLEAPEVSDVAIKVRDGDDASCLNLNQAQTPRLLGVDPAALASRGAFTGEDGADSFWKQLESPLPGGEIPAFVGDANTAMWTLKKKVGPVKGDVLVYKDEAGNEARIKLVATLPVRLSVFQGSLLISQAAFTRLFPSEDGFRMFLLDAPPEREEEVIAQLRKQYDRFGMDAIPAVARMREYAVVESTYLAMFLVLGGLGMVLGSAGMAAVVLRNLFERRAEIAMLSALGFPAALRRRTYFLEFGFLLLAGLGIGGASAGIALLPALANSHSSISLGALLGMVVLVVSAYVISLTLAVLVPLRKADLGVLRAE